MSQQPEFSTLQQIKRHFFAMRNGIIADTLRKAGSPFRIIFGLNLPQLTEAARMFGPDPGLARTLWSNTSTRESMLLAPMLIDKDDFPIATAREWIDAIPAAEVADVLCLKLLRHMPYAWELARELVATRPGDWGLYTGLRLAFNLVGSNPDAALELAAMAPEHPLARALADEAEFLSGKSYL